MIVRRRAQVALMFGVACVLAASGVVGQTSAVAAGFDSRRLGVDLLDLASRLTPLARVLESDGAAGDTGGGTDERMTFLLIGLDARGAAVTRTDALMVVSFEGTTMSAASIPRDTSGIPNPFDGGVFHGKVNTILDQLDNDVTLEEGLDRFELVIENALGIEIDYHVMAWFDGFTTLVSLIDPVIVDVEKEIYDPKHLDDPNGPAGVYFPESTAYALHANNPGGNPRCNGAYQDDAPPISAQYWCRRALPYVRSRKGDQNDDFHRSKRQQFFVAAAIKALSEAELDALVTTAQAQGPGKWWTNYPINAASALELYSSIRNVELVNNVVFKPKTYSGRVPGSSAYELNLAAVREWTALYMR
jgi:LytR_cpsA_psr family